MKKVVLIFIGLIILGVIVSLTLNFYVIFSTKSRILDIDEAIKLDDVDCVLVLGAGIKNGGPTPMLRDRLIIGSKLYNSGVSNNLIVSGDHSKDDYDEVIVMKNYLIDKLDIPSENIYKDHYGIATYDSIYRAKEVFSCKKTIIVTQKYHLYRSLFIASKLGLDAYGVSADLDSYRGQSFRDLREYLARNKDFLKTLVKPKAKYTTEKFSMNFNGDDTNNR